MMRSILVLIVLIALLGIGFVVLQRKSPTPAPTQPVTVSKTPPINPTVEPTASSIVNNLKAGGSSYKDPNGVYIFLYPAGYTQDAQNNGQYIRIYKRGDTQRSQSEMSDGVLMVFESVNLDGKTLESWVNARVQEATADGTLKVIKPKTVAAGTKYTGFTYSLGGLGAADYLVLQKDPAAKNAVSITISVNDPQGIGYQKEVDAIIDTLELLK